jgi:hypothetical protein
LKIHFKWNVVSGDSLAGWEYWDETTEPESHPEFVKIDEGWEVINENEKFLIFVTGTKTWIPHQVRAFVVFSFKNFKNLVCEMLFNNYCVIDLILSKFFDKLFRQLFRYILEFLLGLKGVVQTLKCWVMNWNKHSILNLNFIPKSTFSLKICIKIKKWR